MRLRSAAAVVLALGGPLTGAAPVRAHSEGLTPYEYVVAPPGVESAEDPETGVSAQPIGEAGFAGTTDNQMQLTLPPSALPEREGETRVRVVLRQLDPADLPDLPEGLEPEGNGYRVGMTFATSRRPVDRLDDEATLGLTAPAAPTAVYELVGGRWKKVRFTPVSADSGFSSVLTIRRPGTFLQAYDPKKPAAAVADRPAASTPDPPTAAGVRPTAPVAEPPPSAVPGESDERPIVLVVGGTLLAFGATVVLRRRRGHGNPDPR